MPNPEPIPADLVLAEDEVVVRLTYAQAVTTAAAIVETAGAAARSPGSLWTRSERESLEELRTIFFQALGIL